MWAIPFAGILAHYYCRFRTEGKLPSFLNGGADEKSELYSYLRAMYRQVINGTVGKAREYAEKLITNSFANLIDAANQISIAYIKVPINDKVDEAWLKVNLKRLDTQRAKRVFNALRLPEEDLKDEKDFKPDTYGGKTKDYHIDHLIPISTIDLNREGAFEAQSIPNFAPLPSNLNREAKATPCSAKLKIGGIYKNYIDVAPNPHPYCSWLVEAQSGYYSYLDIQELLEPNSSPAIGSERLDWLAKSLRARI